MAKQHKNWIDGLLSGLTAAERETLMALLAKVKISLGDEGRDAA